MKKFSSIILFFALALFSFPNLQAEHLIVISANDTHSQIEPASDGLGGLFRMRAAFDEIRRNNKNVIADNDADGVQGTLNFSMSLTMALTNLPIIIKR